MTEGRLPILTAREIVKILEKIGFENPRKSKGSHFRYSHPDGRKTTIPIHKRKMLRDIKLSPEDFLKLT